MNRILLILLFTLSCNLDTLLISARCALSGSALTPRAAFAVAALTSAATGASLLMGQLAGSRLQGAAACLGPLVLIVMGVWTTADGLLRPERDTMPRTGNGAALAAALAVNNAAGGVAAGASGIGAAAGTAINFIMTMAMIALGGRLAEKVRAGRLGRYALPLSGVLLALLGALSLLHR